MGNFRAAALNPGAYAVAAAHGITPRTIATWNPSLPRTPRVLVPIEMDALLVRPGDSSISWADCEMQAPPAGQTTTRKALLPPPFKNIEPPRPPGVYLHWALPDGLTHGKATDQSVSFPAIPDRWLILRLSPSPDSGARRAVKGWVLRAADQKPVAVHLDQWQETGNPPGAANPPITSVGYGDPAWAAYYDNVVNRLGYYDDLSDVKSGPIAYLVCGWYSDPSLDPLGASEVHSLTDFDRRMAELGWELKPNELNEAVNRFRKYVRAATMLGLPTREAVSVGTYANFSAVPAASATPPPGSAAHAPVATRFTAPAPSATTGSAPSPLDPSGHPVDGVYTTDGAWWPQLTLYHGSVVALGWPGIGWAGNERGLLSGEAGGPPPSSDIRVAVGNTMGEAIAVLVARDNGAPDEARLLEAFLLGGLRDLEQADGQARVDALLHASAFASRDGGFVEEKIPQQALPPTTPPVPSGPVQADGPGVFKSQSGSGSGQTVKIAEVKDKLAFALDHIESRSFISKEEFSEVNILKGGLAEAVNQGTPPVTQPPIPAQSTTVKRSLPRLFQPADPVILVQGSNRSFKHGADGRFSQDGKLACRLTGFTITELSCNGVPDRPAVSGDDLLEQGVENGSVPPECEDLLRETVLLDPGASMTAARAVASTPVRGGIRPRGTAVAPAAADPILTRNFAVEQTVWWATRDPRVDPGPLVARSGYAGMLPSPIAVTPPVRPWNPIHLDWQVQFIPSSNGVSDWTLNETEFDAGQQSLPSPDDTQSGVILQGRAHLTAGAAATIAQGIRTALSQAASAAGTDPLPASGSVRYHSAISKAMLDALTSLAAQISTLVGVAGSSGGDTGVPAVDRSGLADIASTLESMDVLSGAFDNFHTDLRGGYGGYAGDGKTIPPADSPAPTPFFPVRAGSMRILRLRLVDGFGQIVDLAGSSDKSMADPSQIIKSQPLELPQSPDFSALPPRFTSPARLWFRYMAADGSATEASADVSPVCGYLMPNHLDGDLEFFDTDGTNLGMVSPVPVAGIVWEEAPGQPSTVGQTPGRAIPNSFLAGIAQGLIDWGLADATLNGTREDAVSALLRIVDSTLWSVDPFGHTGDEHLALLVGHPVVVLRARVRLEVQEPIAPEVVNQIAVPLRLGALTHWQDGLLGYFVNDDYRTLYCADTAIAGFARQVGPNLGFLQQINLVPNFYQTFSDDLGANVTEGNSPVTHPYVDDSGVRLILPNQEVALTLLVEPHSVVHATAGLLPRKEIGLRRNWVAAALAMLAPTFRFGPVLVDPKRIRMPVPTELAGSWSWDARADVTTWSEDPVINATTDAILPPDTATGTEGWLRLKPPPVSGNGIGKA